MQLKLQYLGTLCVVLAFAAFATAALARPRRSAIAARHEEPIPAGAGSVSIGHPNRGRLVHGVLLPESESLSYRSGSPDTRWGTTEMVDALHRAANTVERLVPGAHLSVGDISRHNGGRFSPHHSHRNGRDVDIAFYWLDQEGQPVYPNRFVDALPDGTSRSWPEAIRFDDARNWALISTLVADDSARVQYIFVARWL